MCFSGVGGHQYSKRDFFRAEGSLLSMGMFLQSGMTGWAKGISQQTVLAANSEEGMCLGSWPDPPPLASTRQSGTQKCPKATGSQQTHQRHDSAPSNAEPLAAVGPSSTCLLAFLSGTLAQLPPGASFPRGSRDIFHCACQGQAQAAQLLSHR